MTPSTSQSGFVSNGLILNWDVQNSSSYNGGGTITDLQANSNGSVVGTSFTTGSTNYVTLNPGNGSYILSSKNLNPVLSPANTGVNISHFIWVYPTADGVIVDELGANSLSPVWHDSQIEIVGGQLLFRVWNLSSPYLTSNTAISLNTWNYIGLTYDGTNLVGYLNGTNVGSVNYPGRLSPGNNSAGLHYGLSVDDITNMGDGTGADMRFGAFHVYNRALSSSEVVQNYNATRGPY